LAQAAALACCRSLEFVRESRERLLDDRRSLAQALATLGIESLPSQVNFLLARVPQVSELRARLLARHQILVRDCASFGLPGFLRLAARPAPDRARLLAALRAESL
jgi:histidinol-phosphate/aromatic aminotransferase/cobyric acid decarboxylase-like protein